MRMLGALVFSLTLVSSPLFAHTEHEHKQDSKKHDDGHSHSHGAMSSEAVTQQGVQKIQDLVKKGKIDKSWAEVKVTSVEQKTFSKDPEWVVTFKNEQVSDKSKQTIFVFYTLDGHYLATNFSGE